MNAPKRNAPKPCPFCGLRLEYYRITPRGIPVVAEGWRHPEARCFCSGFEVEIEDVPLWNRRAKG